MVAAAGNYGQTPGGLECYGSITAPGNDPTVITVGAVNTHQTDVRDDEGVTYFSSRGPTRGYYLDASGNKRYDDLLKPDVVAPGNRIISAESKDSYLADEYSQLHESGSGTSAIHEVERQFRSGPRCNRRGRLAFAEESGAHATARQSHTAIHGPTTARRKHHSAGSRPSKYRRRDQARRCAPHRHLDGDSSRNNEDRRFARAAGGASCLPLFQASEARPSTGADTSLREAHISWPAQRSSGAIR